VPIKEEPILCLPGCYTRPFPLLRCSFVVPIPAFLVHRQPEEQATKAAFFPETLHHRSSRAIKFLGSVTACCDHFPTTTTSSSTTLTISPTTSTTPPTTTSTSSTTSTTSPTASTTSPTIKTTSWWLAQLHCDHLHNIGS
jgi:hypothetical protein